VIKEFVDKFEKGKAALQAEFEKAHPDCYGDIVKMVIEVLADGSYDHSYESPDPKRIHEIDDGDYQGTLVFVIAGKGYQPSSYWYVRISYGSCSGCDTLEAIKDYRDAPPTEEQIKDYMTLALHIVQGLKYMGGYDEIV